MSAEESGVLRDRSSQRYLDSLPYVIKASGETYPADAAAYDRFIDWAVEESEEVERDEAEPAETAARVQNWEKYDEEKHRREDRVKTALSWDSQFATSGRAGTSA